jgi:hypothetical protein
MAALSAARPAKTPATIAGGSARHSYTTSGDVTKEFHVVVRCGGEGLGEWHSERRNLYTDYRRYMGEPPARIVRIWLIANSVFQRGEGICDYADIRLLSETGQERVL